MQRISVGLVILMLFLCGCSLDQRETAVSDSWVYGAQNEQSDTQNPSQNDPSVQDEQGASSDEPVSLNGKERKLGAGWKTGAAALYQDTAYYSLSHAGQHRVYYLKLGKGQSPEYLCEGEVQGVYGNFLLGEVDGRYSLLDLSQKKSEWTVLSNLLEGERARFYHKNKLYIFAKEEVVVIDFGKKTARNELLSAEIKKISLVGDCFYYTVKDGAEQILYCGDIKTKTSRELYRCADSYEWIAAEGRILWSRTGESPFVYEVKSGKTFVPRAFYCDLYTGPDTPQTKKIGGGRVCVQYRTEEDMTWRYWQYNVKSGKGEELETPPAPRYALLGGSYQSIEEGVFLVEVGEKSYRLSGEGIHDANEYGAVYAKNGMVYTLLWKEGSSYEYYPVTEHPAP